MTAAARTGASARMSAADRAGAETRTGTETRANTETRAGASSVSGPQLTASPGRAEAGDRSAGAGCPEPAAGAGRPDPSAADTVAAEPSAPLSADGIGVVLGGRQVLHDVSIRVDSGRIHTLLGPNGAGKTTLVRTLLGLQKPVAGTVRRRGRIGYVPQRTEMDWDFPVTAQDVVLLGLVRGISRLRGPRPEHYRAVARALTTVRLADLRDRPVGEMSGGQRQRVLIARALAQDPSALVLDEPFTGLDMPSQELLSDLFRDLAREGRAVLMSTHDLTHALDIADRVTLLNRTVIAEGSPDRLREREPWMRAFAVSERSPLLRQVGALA